MNRLYTLLAAASLALALATGALAAPAPSVSAITATAAGADLTVTWSLGTNEYGSTEYACGLTLTSSTSQRFYPLDPTSTSSTNFIEAAPGATVTVDLATAAVSAATKPGDACFQSRTTSSTTATVPTPPPAPEPAPAPAPTEPVSAPTSPAEAGVSAPTGPTLDDRLTELEKAVAAITTRVGNLETANLAAWDAFVAALAAGKPADEAALAARSAAMNALYGLG